MKQLSGLSIHITGVVQGVGFRPFVYGLATRLSLTGWVRNTSAGVDIEADGDRAELQHFLEALQEKPPPLARIDSFRALPRTPNGFTAFEIVHSDGQDGDSLPVSPDVTVCEDCLREMADPSDRRYGYPFINCTNCGPRFTIIKGIPYDRPKTTMARFEMCPSCREEYEDPLNRRFHAQPVACPDCGPHAWIERKEKGDEPDGGGSSAALEEARRLLAEGCILAVKGLGGFHLACDALNAGAVAELRRRKLRVDKPFALMVPDAGTAAAYCLLDDAERELLCSRRRPIVVLRRRPDSAIARAVAPQQDTLGLMLPYTPLHELLFRPGEGQKPLKALVMTSGNLSEEPIATGNREARERLARLADAFLMHDRDIRTRCDDSVVRVVHAGAPGDPLARQPVLLRRSRGYAPDPIRLPWESMPLLAAGAELKNTFCLARERYAFISHHIGDLQNLETLQAFEDGVAHFERLFRVRPEAITCDLHPDYLATRYAQRRAEEGGLPLLGVQHHHAHIAACMAEYGLGADRRVIGLAFDGTGYGDDGAVWGGEVLLSSYAGFERAFHLKYIPLPGGDKAVREPWRTALSWLRAAGIPWEDDLPPVLFARGLSLETANPLEVLERQLERGLNAPPTSSMGRLFDAVSALLGVRGAVNYEAQAAIELEALADPDECGRYAIGLKGGVIDPSILLRALVDGLRAGVPAGVLAARFHNSLAHMVLEVCRRVREESGVSEAALSGGVWQNALLLRASVPLLLGDGFTVLLHEQVPPNDGGLSLGQAAVAFHRLKEGSETL